MLYPNPYENLIFISCKCINEREKKNIHMSRYFSHKTQRHLTVSEKRHPALCGKEKKRGKNTCPRGEWKTSIYVPLSTRSMMEWHKMSLPATKTCAQLICNLFLGNCFEGLQEDGSINQDCNDLSVDTDIFNWCNISFILIQVFPERFLKDIC